MKKLLWPVLVSGAVLVPAAFAAEEEPPQQVAQQSSVYRCTEPDGSHTYTDSPCSGEGVHIGNKTPASTPSPLPQRPLAGSLPPECQRWQDEMDWRIKRQTQGELSPTSPAYLIWLQRKIDECKGDGEAEGLETPRTGGEIPDPVDRSHLYDNLPRNLEPGGTKDGNWANVSPPSSYDLRSQRRLPPVRDQEPFGTCWAHTAQGAAESNAISQGFASATNIDLSEMYLAWFLFGDSRPGKSFLTHKYA